MKIEALALREYFGDCPDDFEDRYRSTLSNIEHHPRNISRGAVCSSKLRPLRSTQNEKLRVCDPSPKIVAVLAILPASRNRTMAYSRANRHAGEGRKC